MPTPVMDPEFGPQNIIWGVKNEGYGGAWATRPPPFDPLLNTYKMKNVNRTMETLHGKKTIDCMKLLKC